MRTCTHIVTVLACLSMAAGCVSSGETTLSDAAMAGDPDTMWTEGQDLARNGERLIRRGEARMLEARRLIRDGEARIRTGSEQVLKCRVDYEDVVNGTERATASSADEAKRLKAIGKRWEDALDAIREGNLLVEKGNRGIETGRGEVREGRTMVETGSILMRNSERSRRGDALLPMINRLESTSER
jgi:hypothetical protein